MKKRITNPPWLAYWLLNIFTSKGDNDSIIGDFDEEYFYLLKTRGIIFAKLWYWKQLFISIPLIIKDTIYWSTSMFKSYLLIALRSLKKNKGFSFINITGLALGLACALLIYSFIDMEIGYDTFHKNAERIYKVRLHAKLGDQVYNMANSPAVAAETMLDEIPEVENSTRLRDANPVYLVDGVNSFKEEKFFYADSNFLEIFTVDLIMGNSNTALKEPNSIILTPKSAKKYFGNSNPIGQIIRMDSGLEYKVTAVANPMPANSHFHFDFLASLSSIKSKLKPYWLGNQVYTYILLREGQSIETVNKKIPPIVKRLAGPQMAATMGVSYEEFINQGNFLRMETQPLLDIHLGNGIRDTLEPTGSMTNIYIFSTIGLMILLMGGINFVNLSTAKTAIRAKEIGVRKVLGTQRNELIKQFLVESVLMCLLAFVVAIFLITLISPILSSLATKELGFILFEKPQYLVILFGFALLLGLVSGIYPALLFSKFNIVSVLRGKLNSRDSMGNLRRVLVISQFTITAILIASTIIIYNQLQYIKYKDLGYDPQQILVLEDISSLADKKETFKNDILNDTKIISASLTETLPERSQAATVFRSDEGDVEKTYAFAYNYTDQDFAETFSTKMKQGRFFSKEYSADSLSAVINETAMAELGLKNPIGKRLVLNQGETAVRMNIIGVMEDFHVASLHEEMKPVVFFYFNNPDGDNVRFLSLKVKPGMEKEAVELVEGKWKEYGMSKPLEYSFMNEDFNNFYKEDIRIGNLFTTFSVLAIFIACLGLLGLISFSAERKTKEIGIRKTLGASEFKILVLLSKEFSLWILISNLIAIPISYYFMEKWLQDFAFRVSISFWEFLLAFTLTIIIALLTSLYQTVKAAKANPVESLRNE